MSNLNKDQLQYIVNGNGPIGQKTEEERKECLEEMFQMVCDEIKDEMPIINAVREGDLELVEELIKEGKYDINFEYWNDDTAFTDAASVSNYPMMKLLLKYGANIDAGIYSLNSPLLVAVSNNKFKLVRFLLKNGATNIPQYDLENYCTEVNEKIIKYIQKWPSNKYDDSESEEEGELTEREKFARACSMIKF